MSRSAALLASLLVTLGRPAWWLLALAAFLLRGGAVLFVIPIIAIPSPLAISNVAAPLIVPIALGRAGSTVVIAAIVAIALFLWLVIGGWLAAAIELALVRESAAAAIEEGVAGPEAAAVQAAAQKRAVDRDGVRGFGLETAGQILGTRLVVALPLAAALAVGVVRIVEVAYAELLRPTDIAASLPMRVVEGAASEIAIIALAWLGAELVAGVAARWVALEGLGVRTAIRRSAVDVIVRPRSNLLPWMGASLVLSVVLGGSLLAARIAWDQVQTAMAATRPDGVAIAAALLVFVVVWLIGLAGTGFLGAIRTVSGVFEFERTSITNWAVRATAADRQTAEGGTFGASKHHRPGDWSVDDDGGSL